VEEAVDLIVVMLSVTPSERPTASDVYAKDFFSESEPRATPREQLECIGAGDSHTLSLERGGNGTFSFGTGCGFVSTLWPRLQLFSHCFMAWPSRNGRCGLAQHFCRSVTGEVVVQAGRCIWGRGHLGEGTAGGLQAVVEPNTVACLGMLHGLVPAPHTRVRTSDRRTGFMPHMVAREGAWGGIIHTGAAAEGLLVGAACRVACSASGCKTV
jgi:hypothetical protein